MIRYSFLLLLLVPVLLVPACGGGGGGNSVDTWEPDTDVISDEGSAAMVSIPAGEALVGIKHRGVLKTVPKKPRRRYLKSVLRRKTFAKDFKMDKYEVTNHNYYTFLQTLDEETRKKYRPRHQIKGIRHPYWKKSRYKKGKGDFPVTGITHSAARDYADWRGKRLPDEFEWEYAARGKNGCIFGAGSDQYNPDKYNVSESWDEESRMVAVNDPKNTSDVSPFNCIGMGGNVSEWCTTREIREYNILDKDTGKPLKGERQKLKLKAFRGPHYNSMGEFQCVLSFQGYKTPKPKIIGDRLDITIGFRCAR